MTDEQIVKALRCWTGKTVKDAECAKCSFGEDCSLGEIVEATETRINELNSENAAMRERLSHSLELPYMEKTVSQFGTEDTILYYMENGKLQQECFNNKFPEQLQARLAELKGE